MREVCFRSSVINDNKASLSKEDENAAVCGLLHV